MSAHDVHLRADEAPGMLTDWTGPVAWRSLDGQHRAGVWLADYDGRPGGSLSMADLDARRPEVAARIVAWAYAGERCRYCDGTGRLDRATANPTKCEPCNGTGRIHHDLTPFLPTTLPGGRIASVEHSAALLVASVRGIVAGVGPVAGVVGPWQDCGDGVWGRSVSHGGVALTFADGGMYASAGPMGWRIYFDPRGSETGEAGRACADAAFLRLRFALLDADTLTLPEAPRG